MNQLIYCNCPQSFSICSPISNDNLQHLKKETDHYFLRYLASKYSLISDILIKLSGYNRS